MKKVLAIALAVMLAMTAVASFAIVNRDGSVDGKKVWFDSVSISTSYALADYGLSGVSVLADPNKTYVANEVIFGYLKFGFDDNRPDPAADISVRVGSDYATFPTYLNTAGGFGRAHYTNPQAALPTFPAYGYNTTTGAQLVTGFVSNPFRVTQDADDEEFIVTFYAGASASASPVAAGFNADLARLKAAVSAVPSNQSSSSPFRKVTSEYVSEFYVGFNGVVKLSTAAEGIIKAYVQVGGSSKFNNVQTVAQARFDLIADGKTPLGNDFGAQMSSPTSISTRYIDVYKDGSKFARVFGLGILAVTSGVPSQFGEYLVQFTDGDDDTYVDYGIGFLNDNDKKFSRFTYRAGLATDGTGIVTANINNNLRRTDLAGIGGFALNSGVNQLWENAASITWDGVAYKFFRVENHNVGQVASYIIKKNALDAELAKAMDFFGFSFGYYNATKNADYESAGGWNATQTVTFKYFGAVIPDADDDIVPAETGDASTTIVIVLAASALLAAAALFFVMKKARD